MSKLTLEVSPEMNTMLGELAGRRGLAKTQVLRRAVALLRYLDSAGENEEVILRNRKTGEEKVLLLESQM